VTKSMILVLSTDEQNLEDEGTEARDFKAVNVVAVGPSRL
jgi:hypothetical protein